jgi:serine/threonine protein kinase
MEHACRGSLAQLMKKPSITFDWEMALKFAIQLLEGVHTLHTWNPVIVHRDIKTSNLLVRQNNSYY